MNKTTTLVLAAIAGFGLSAQARTTTTNLWNVDFSKVTTSQETGIVKLADLDASAMETAFTDGSWDVQADDDSYVTNAVGTAGLKRLELDTQGNNLTWTPSDTGPTGNVSIVEMDVRFVAADDAPDGFEADSVQTAFYLWNDYRDEHGDTQDEPQSLQLFAWTYDKAGETNHWEAIGDPFASTFAESNLHVQILIDYTDDTIPYLHVSVNGTEVTGEGVVAANFDTSKTAGKMRSVTFKGTGTVDNFTGRRINKYYDTCDFTAQIYLDGVPNSTIMGASELVDADRGAADTEYPDFKASFANIPIDNAVFPSKAPTYALSSIVIVDLSTGNETAYDYTYDKTEFDIVPVTTACPDATPVGRKLTLTPSTYGATNDSVIAKLYYNTLDAYYARAVVNVGEDSVTYQQFVKPSSTVTTNSWTFPNTTNGTYVLRSVVVANGATFDSETGVVSYEVPAAGIGSNKIYATVTYEEGDYDAEALEWVYNAGTGTYTLQRKTFTITWMNGEDTLAVTNGVAYGDVPEYYGAEPTKASTAQYDYAFTNWSPVVIAATSNATYNASFTETVRSYDITWVADGNADQVTSVAYGDTPVAPEVTAPEGKVLDGWTPAIVEVTGATTYTAVFVDAAPDVATVISIADGTTHNYKSLAAAIAAANAGDTVKLLDNAVVSSTVVVDKDLVVDLGGYYVSNTVVRSGESIARVFQTDAGNVVVTNGTLYGRVNCYDTSTLTIAAETTVEGYVLVWGTGVYGEAGCMTPTLNVYGTIDGGSDVVLFNGNGDTSKPNINVFPGAVLETDCTGYAITLREANFTMTGGTIDADWGIFATNATIAVSGGTINAGNRAIDADFGTAVTISGGSVNADDSGIGLWKGSTLTMTDGEIVAGDFGVFNNGNEAIPTTMAISGGSVTSTNGTACGIYQAGLGSLTLSGTAVVRGADAVEVRAGTVEVQNNAQLIATAPYSAPTSNGGGTSGHGGVALLVSQHTTTNAVSATVSGGTLQGPVAFEEASVESNADPTVVSGEIAGGTILGEVKSEDIDELIPSDSEALFADAGAEGVEEGYGLQEDPENPGLYKVVKTYVVTYANYDGTALQVTTNFVNDATPAYAGETPAKPADASGIYAFTGFGTIAETVVADATYTAQFSTTTSKATVITITDAGATTNTVGYYATLADAIHAADDGDTVVLLADETADATKTTQADRLVVTNAITIDFGEYTYSVPGSLEPTANWCALYIDADTTVKGTTGGINCLDKSDPNDLCGVYAFNVRNGATLTIEGGVYHGGGTVIQTQLGSTVINGGTFSVTPFDAPYGYDFALNCVDSAYGADTAGFEINGGTFVGFDPQDIAAEGEHTDFTDDGYVAIDDGNGNFVVQAGYNVTFDANGGSPTPAAQRVAAGGTATAPAAPAKAGCTFAGWKLNNAAYDFATVLSADIELVAAYDAAKATVITITDAGATTNTVGYYATLADAIHAADDGDTVVLLANVNEAINNTADKNFTIDLNGQTWSSDSDVLATSAGTITINATNGGTMTTEAAQCCAVWAKGGDVVINGGTFNSKDNEEATIYVSHANSVVTINGGTFENTDTRPYRWKSSLQALTLNVKNDLVGQHLVINGGTFIGNDPQLGDDTAGGTFAQSDVAFVSDGYVAIVDGEGNFVVQEGYNVTFDANGGSPTPDAQRVAKGGKATAPTAPTKDSVGETNYTFRAWQLAGSDYDFDTVLSADITLVAAWTEESQEEGHIGAKSENGFVILAPEDADYETSKPLTFAAPDLTAGTVQISASMVAPDSGTTATLKLLYKTSLTGDFVTPAPEVTISAIDTTAGTATVTLPANLPDTVFFFGFSNEAGVVDKTSEP